MWGYITYSFGRLKIIRKTEGRGLGTIDGGRILFFLYQCWGSYVIFWNEVSWLRKSWRISTSLWLEIAWWGACFALLGTHRIFAWHCFRISFEIITYMIEGDTKIVTKTRIPEFKLLTLQLICTIDVKDHHRMKVLKKSWPLRVFTVSIFWEVRQSVCPADRNTSC